MQDVFEQVAEEMKALDVHESASQLANSVSKQETSVESLISAFESFGFNEESAHTLAGLQQAANKTRYLNEDNSVGYDLSVMGNDTFDLSALADICNEIKTKENIQTDKVKTDPLLMQVLNAYDEAIKEGGGNTETFHRNFLMKLKRKNKGQKRKNMRKKQSRTKGAGYQSRLSQHVNKSKSNKKKRREMKRIY